MGTGISANYSDVEEISKVGYWTVHSAVDKKTKRPVALWEFDQTQLKKLKKATPSPLKYLTLVLESVKTMQKIRHPNILQIYEIDPSPSSPSFVSEPIQGIMGNGSLGMQSLTKDEVFYFAYEIAALLAFLHNDIGKALICFSVSDIAITTDFKVKIWSAPFITAFASALSPIEFSEWGSSLYIGNNEAIGHELRDHGSITPAIDTYAYGMIVKDLLAGAYADTAVPAPFRSLVERCMGRVDNRPTFDQILNHECFSSLVVSMYNYMKLIESHTFADIYNFYTGLVQYIKVFSQRALDTLFIPMFAKHTTARHEFGNITFKLFFEASGKISSEVLTEVLFEGLFPILKESNDQLHIFLQYYSTLVENVTADQLSDYVFPTVLSCISSTDEGISKEAFSLLPSLLEHMSESSIRYTIYPLLCKLLSTTESMSIAASCIKAFQLSIKKVDAVFLAEKALPAISASWTKFKNLDMVIPIIELLESFDGDIDVQVGICIPLAASILSVRVVSFQDQDRLIKVIQQILEKLCSSRGDACKSRQPAHSSSATDNPFSVNPDDLPKDALSIGNSPPAFNSSSIDTLLSPSAPSDLDFTFPAPSSTPSAPPPSAPAQDLFIDFGPPSTIHQAPTPDFDLFRHVEQPPPSKPSNTSQSLFTDINELDFDDDD